MRPSEIRRQQAQKRETAQQKQNTAGPTKRRPRKTPNPPSLLVKRTKRTPLPSKKDHPKFIARCHELLPLAKRIATEVGIELSLIMAVARVESGYNPKARNRRSGATGLMQVMPSTGRGFQCGDLTDAEKNMRCGSRVLKRYLKYFDGDLLYGVAAYHTGPVAPKKAKKQKKLPRNMNYVEKVLKLRTRFKRRGCD